MNTSKPALPELLYDAIKDVLMRHRLSYTEGEDGEAFPLVDRLCPPGSRDISKGSDEITLICDAIYNDDVTRAAITAAVAEALAAATSPTMPAEPQTRSQRIDAAGFMRRPSLWVLQAREALELIAAPMRSDGTWNRDREACRQIAAEALGRYDDNEPAPPARVALSEHRSRFEKWWLGRGGTRPSLYVTPAGEYEDADVAFHWGIWMEINGITQAQSRLHR